MHRLTREIGIALTVSFFGSTDGTDKTIKIVAISFFKHKDAFQILDAKVSFMHFVRYKEAQASYLHFWNQVYRPVHPNLESWKYKAINKKFTLLVQISLP